jgi:lipid-A-disaccharide synthase
MEAEGVELLAGLEDLAVMGFVEVLGRIRFFRRLERQVREHVRDEQVDLVIPIDYPGFNMRAARYSHDLGIPVLYYIAPQVWAWRAGRARALAETTREVAVILPFEVDLLERAGANATFVGHPLLERPDDVPDDAAFPLQVGPRAGSTPVGPASRLARPGGRTAPRCLRRSRGDPAAGASRAPARHRPGRQRAGAPLRPRVLSRGWTTRARCSGTPARPS